MTLLGEQITQGESEREGHKNGERGKVNGERGRVNGERGKVNGERGKVNGERGKVNGMDKGEGKMGTKMPLIVNCSTLTVNR